MATTPEPVTVQLAVGVETVIGRTYERDNDGDYIGERDETVGDRVAQIIADRVYQAHKDELYNRDSDRVTAAIDRAIEERVNSVLNNPTTPTDSFGNPKGAPTTLAELIDARLTKWFNDSASRDSYNRVTNLQKIIDGALGHAMTADVNGAIKNAKAEAVAQVHSAAASVFTEIIARAAGIK